MSHPTSASGQSTSFNTNVNRAKTKKWVEAKSYSYDGDDWGEVDDYDEYGGYDQSPLEVKPTGLRQRGQSASQTTQGPYDARHDLYQSPVDDRPGNTGGPHRQQQCGGRSVTNSQPQAYPAGARRNSFDPEDDRRAFSAGDPSQNISNAAATEYPTAQVPQVQSTVAQDFQSGPFFPNLSFRTQPGPTGPLLHIPGRTSMEDQVRYEQQAQSPSGSNRSGFYPDHPPPPDMGSRTQSMTSNTSVQDLHHRRDFSPSAVPPPLQTRGSPSLHGNSDSRSFSWHPPRKSSLSQDTPPTLPFPMQLPPISSVRDPEEELPPLRERSGSNGKQLPFVRPADIYRRMQEEKEKERQSQESSRPSMDSIMGKSSDRPSLGKSQNCESSQRLKPTLVSVTERKSEYDLEGVDLGNQVTPEEPRPTAKIFELPTRTSNTTSQNTTSSLRPMLPDVSRVSGFGESFFGTPRGSNEQSDETHPEPPTLSHAAVQDQPGNNDLQYQLSPGFTSAVHQAFDSAEDQVPPTPTSTADSTIGRSASGGTSTVSPIISRGPSAVTENRNSKLPGIDDVTISTSGEAPATSSTRPLSSSSLGTPKQIARKPSPSQLAMPRASESPPPSFIPGHRRDLSTPSPDNSPARTPAVEVSRQLRQPQEVEISRGSPTDPSPTSRSSSQVSEITSGEGSDITRSTLEVSRFRGGPSVDSRSVARNAQGKADSATSSISHPQHYLRSRTDSGGSSRVRNLADKFESASRPGSAHSTTPRASMLGNHEQRKNELDPLRPLADRMESFRPHLPGGWESSASIAPAANVAGLQLASETQPTESTTKSVVPDTNWTGDDGSNDEVTEHSGQAPSTAVQIKDASEEAFTAVAAAGTALAGAFAAAVGMDQHSSPSGIIPQTPPDQEFREKESQDSGPNITKPDASMNKAFNPEALRPDMPYFMDDDTSTADSTPLPKNAPLHLTEDPETRDYFTSASQDQDSFEKPGSLEEPAVEKRPPILPSLSTDIKTHEYESDRLHREIVRELSPMVTSEPTTAESDFSNHDNVSRFSANANLPRPGHDSGVLPREYESYWNEANSDDDLHQSDGEPGGLEDATTAKRQQGAAVVGEPLHPRKSEQTTHSGPTIQDGAFPNSPHVLQHHFSWEQLRQGLPSAPPDSIHEAAPAPESNIFSSAIYPGGRDFHLHDEQQNHDDADQMSQIPTTAIPISNDSSRLSEGNVPIPGAENFFSSRSATLNVERDLSGYSGGLEVAPTLSENQLTKPVDVSAGSTNSVAFESPAMPSERGQESERPPPVPILSQPSPQVVPAQDDGLRPLPPNAQPKIPAFRELLALKSPSDRIRAYNNTRQQFADLNTGLAHWLAATTKDLPEHADLLKNTGSPAFQGHKPSPSRSKLGGLRQSGGQPGQQHYLQQHLNASPQPSLSDGAGPGGAPQGYSPSGGSGGKLSSQQVQAKGKDLLHTAGIFGGKANVAAKGLFSKGRSKLKGSGGADKV